ncbi:N-acetyltransferase 5 [Nosema bombycis CQ1]|uniref:N-acetyltransferase 5 n=1 Tax=Nosema bombycis (strain CQ1 / CVCC 102059) TaxID=578461 RepID=R0MH88_NOSB1|nr:N-acetyltransferase 5 [Nosema bombycis CQ1]|eukprot:EOB13495.1 N-acetyltransferase 5 [Nosema bombycis CQ1]
MYRISPLLPEDLFSMDIANLDGLTESFDLFYYLYYLVNHTEDCFFLYTTESTVFNSFHSKDIQGYVLGKLEEKENICAHLSALSVAPNSRRLGYGKYLLEILESNGNHHNAYFADLFVRQSNLPAIRFYRSLGYDIYRKVLQYYGHPIENAYEMRKSLDMDPTKKCMEPGDDMPR